MAERLVRSGMEPREILEKLATGDPLGLLEAGAGRLRERFLLVEPDRLFHQGMLRIALAAPGPRHDGSFDSWLAERIDEAIDETLRQDQERLMQDPESWRPEHHGFLEEWIGIPPKAALKAAVQFNGLSHSARRVFFEFMVEGRSVAHCLEAGLGPVERLRANARRALSALLDVPLEVHEVRATKEGGK
jgi:hypothetical protein